MDFGGDLKMTIPIGKLFTVGKQNRIKKLKLFMKTSRLKFHGKKMKISKKKKEKKVNSQVLFLKLNPL